MTNITNWIHRCIIVPAPQAKFARAMALAIAGQSGGGMWVTKTSSTGIEPATHYISAGLIDEQFASLMPLTQYPGDAEPIHTPGRAQIAAHLATQGGFEVSTEQVQELFDACDSSEQEPYEALARVGLTLVTHTGDINNPEASTGDGVNLNTDNTPILDEDGT
jgi:hypothetical protein